MAYTLTEACEPFALFEDVTCDCEGIGQEEVEEILAQATDALVAMTGFNYRGQCVETFRPVGPCTYEYSCLGGPSGFTVPSPVNLDTDGEPDILVTIDGVEFDDWALVDGNHLVRTDGQAWPHNQDLGLADNADGAFAVTVGYGDPPSIIARNAVVEIACLFLKRNPNSQRGLPANTRSVAAQGVTITLDALENEINRQAFMLPWTIRFLTVYAPQGRHQPYVYSPELDDGFRLHQVQ